jgi:hypothetical protein
MSLLLRLPEVLSSLQLSTWLTIVDVARLDSAFCTTALREEFLKLVYCGLALLQTADMLHFDLGSDPMIAWILEKRALIGGVHVTETFLGRSDLRKEYLRQHGASLKWVTYASDDESDGDQESPDQNNESDEDSDGSDGSESAEDSSEYACGRMKLHRRRDESALDIAQYCPNLTRFYAGGYLGDLVVAKIAKRCPLLDLTLEGECCTNAAILRASIWCTQLQLLSLASAKLNEECIAVLVRNNPGLQKLKFDGVTDDHTPICTLITQVGVNCPTLTELSIWFAVVSQPSLSFLLSRCQHLKSLLVINCLFEDIIDEQTAAVNSSIAKISLMSVSLMSHDHVRLLLSVCPGLVELQIVDCEELSDLGSLKIGTSCPALQVFSICTCTGAVGGDEMLLDISAHCQDLRLLRMKHDTLVTDVGLSAVARHCTKLQEVDVQNCENVTDRFLTTLSQCCHGLKVLDVSGCPLVTDKGVNAILQECSGLTRLSAEYSVGVTWELRTTLRERYSAW